MCEKNLIAIVLDGKINRDFQEQFADFIPNMRNFESCDLHPFLLRQWRGDIDYLILKFVDEKGPYAPVATITDVAFTGVRVIFF